MCPSFETITARSPLASLALATLLGEYSACVGLSAAASTVVVSWAMPWAFRCLTSPPCDCVGTWGISARGMPSVPVSGAKAFMSLAASAWGATTSSKALRFFAEMSAQGRVCKFFLATAFKPSAFSAAAWRSAVVIRVQRSDASSLRCCSAWRFALPSRAICCTAAALCGAICSPSCDPLLPSAVLPSLFTPLLIAVCA